MRAIFQKKGKKIFENLVRNLQKKKIKNILKKDMWFGAIIARNKLLEQDLPLVAASVYSKLLKPSIF